MSVIVNINIAYAAGSSNGLKGVVRSLNADDKAKVKVAEKRHNEPKQQEDPKHSQQLAKRSLSKGMVILDSLRLATEEFDEVVQRVGELASKLGSGSLSPGEHQALENEAGHLAKALSDLAQETGQGGPQLVSDFQDPPDNVVAFPGSEGALARLDLSDPKTPQRLAAMRDRNSAFREQLDATGAELNVATEELGISKTVSISDSGSAAKIAAGTAQKFMEMGRAGVAAQAFGLSQVASRLL